MQENCLDKTKFGHVATQGVAMNLKRELFKDLLLVGILGGCAVTFAIARAPLWITMTASIFAALLSVIT